MARFFYGSNSEVLFLQRNRIMRKFRVDILQVSEQIWFAPYNSKEVNRLNLLYQPQNEDQIFFTRPDLPKTFWVMQIYSK